MESVLLKSGLSPAVYFKAVNDILPEEWMVWEPETVWAEIEELTGIDADSLPDITRNKIMSYRMAHNSSAPWEDWPVFTNVALTFSGVVPNTDTAQVLSPSQVAWAITKLRDIHPDWDFSIPVRSFAAVMLYNDGICWVPGILGDLVNDTLFNLQKNFDGLGDFIRALAENYVQYMGEETVPGESAADIHTARIKAMERYVRAQLIAEEVANR